MDFFLIFFQMFSMFLKIFSSPFSGKQQVIKEQLELYQLYTKTGHI